MNPERGWEVARSLLHRTPWYFYVRRLAEVNNCNKSKNMYLSLEVHSHIIYLHAYQLGDGDGCNSRASGYKSNGSTGGKKTKKKHELLTSCRFISS